jgi:uncharacterized protein YkwD
MNDARGNAPRLRQSAALNRAAKAHADDMVARNYFSHVSPSGSRVINRVGTVRVPVCVVAEYIAQGQSTWSDVFYDWMSSAGHRKSMLNPIYHNYRIAVTNDTWVLVLHGSY